MLTFVIDLDGETFEIRAGERSIARWALDALPADRELLTLQGAAEPLAA